MVVHLGHYRLSVPFIKFLYEKYKDTEKLATLVSSIAVSTNVPVIAVYYYVAEFSGLTSEIDANIKSLMTFYQYERVEE